MNNKGIVITSTENNEKLSGLTCSKYYVGGLKNPKVSDDVIRLENLNPNKNILGKFYAMRNKNLMNAYHYNQAIKPLIIEQFNKDKSVLLTMKSLKEELNNGNNIVIIGSKESVDTCTRGIIATQLEKEGYFRIEL